MPPRRPVIIAHHLIFTGYGFWLSNDLRGSGSTEIRNPVIRPLGDAHFGRRPRHEQPARQELRDFYRRAEPLLEHAPLWFDVAKRQAIAEALAQIIATCCYTCWACAILSNHVHLVIRRHRDTGEAIWRNIAGHVAACLHDRDDVPPDHPIWASRPYDVFLESPDEVRHRIEYVNDNPRKEGLPLQTFAFVRPYDGWPHTSRR